MKWFRSREVKGEPTVAELSTRLGQVEAAMRSLETEQLTLHDQVRKWMRRALASERAVERGAGASPRTAHASGPAPPTTGVRARRMANALAERLVFPMAPAPPSVHDEANGNGED